MAEGNNLTVAMDVNFYAYSNGAAPSVFATDNIRGTYTDAPICYIPNRYN